MHIIGIFICWKPLIDTQERSIDKLWSISSQSPKTCKTWTLWYDNSSSIGSLDDNMQDSKIFLIVDNNKMKIQYEDFERDANN